MDLVKGKGNRDGLIQQIVTYVRDGHTVVRKQWVRSTFADHAKKNEEQKKKTLLEEKEKEDAKHTKKIQEENEKARNRDKRAKKKHIADMEEATGKKARVKQINHDHLDKYKKELEKKKKEEENRKKEEEKKKKDKKGSKKDKHSSYGQQDTTRADNKAEQKMMQT